MPQKMQDMPDGRDGASDVVRAQVWQILQRICVPGTTEQSILNVCCKTEAIQDFTCSGDSSLHRTLLLYHEAITCW